MVWRKRLFGHGADSKKADKDETHTPDLAKRIFLDKRALIYIVFRYILVNVTKAEYETLASFRYELRSFLNFSEREAEKHGLAAQQYLALLAIEGYPGRDFVTIGELAERLKITSHSAVGLVDRLEAVKLVKRRASDEDRRRVLVRLTAHGRKKLERLATAHHTELQSVGPLLVGLLKQVTGDSPKR